MLFEKERHVWLMASPRQESRHTFLVKRFASKDGKA